MSAKVVDGRKIAEKIKNDVSKQVKELSKRYDIRPNITTIKIGNDPSSELYLKLRDKACERVGIKSNHIEYSDDVSQDKIYNKIKSLNEDDDVHGILIQFPVPAHLEQDILVDLINPKKDVEGFNPENMGKTLIGDEQIIPCTPLSVLTIIENEEVDLKGKDVVIVNHSNIVGKPLAALFLNRNASVSVCHVFTKDMKRYTSNADILISAAGVANLIKADYVKNDAFVIDVGIIKTENGICGDVDFDSVKEKAGVITPVPGGVGPVTVAVSLNNMIKTFLNCVEDK